MLEPYVLGEHWHVPSGFRREHSFVAAMEGASLINSAYPHISVSSFLWDFQSCLRNQTVRWATFSLFTHET
jgi:hypothetical protein